MMFGNPNASLYTNKIIGLPHTPEFLNTIVKLDEPRRPPIINSSSSSSDNDDDGDDGNPTSDEEMQNASTYHNSRSKRWNSSNTSKFGPSKRPTQIKRAAKQEI